MTASLAEPDYVGDLGNGLVCRWSTAADQPKIAQCMGKIYRNTPEEAYHPRAMDIARVLMAGDFPYMGPDDFALVEDTTVPGSPVVAYTCLWRLRWRYGDIPFGVGQPEMVATDAAYRNRGLVRALFAMVHARSEAEGHLVQAITGIPYFYRQFGYEFVLDLEGNCIVPVAAIPVKEGDAAEPFHLRLAVLDDVPQLMALYDRSRGESLVWNDVPESFWRHHIAAWDDPFVQNDPLRTILHGRLYMVVTNDGAPAGYVRAAAKHWDEKFQVWGLHLGAPVNWQIAAPWLLRALRARRANSGHRRQCQATRRDRVDAGPQPSALHDPGADVPAAHGAALRLVPARAGCAGISAPHCAGAGGAAGELDCGGIYGRVEDRSLP